MTTLREICENDLEKIMQWRMDPDITKYMNTNPKLTLEGQKKWLTSINSDDTVMHWIIEQDSTAVGVINLIDIDWENKTSSWGYYIGDKKNRSLKLAISLEMSLYDYVFDVLGFSELHNEVFSLNNGVIKLHLACGSHITKEVPNEITKDGVSYDITHISITKDEWNLIRDNKKYEKICYDIIFCPHHIGYAVNDIPSSLAAYKKLGYYQASQIYNDLSRNVDITFIRNYSGGLPIELISPINEKSPITKTLKNMKGLATPYHICYEVASIEKSISILKKRGFVPTTQLSPAVAFDNRRVIFMLNKQIGLIELVEK